MVVVVCLFLNLKNRLYFQNVLFGVYLCFNIFPITHLLDKQQSNVFFYVGLEYAKIAN